MDVSLNLIDLQYLTNPDQADKTYAEKIFTTNPSQ